MKTKYQLLLFSILSLLLSINANAQVDVSSSGGTINASYPTLKGAFDAINAGIHTGTIAMGISGNTTENAPAILNASGDGLASYTGVTISPMGGVSRTISSSLTFTGFALVILNGADNITINGSFEAGPNSICPPVTVARNLTFVRSEDGDAVVACYTNANNNKVINCNIRGTFDLNMEKQVIYGIYNSASHNNQFINNSITNSHYAIYSAGHPDNKNTGTIIAQNSIDLNLSGGIFVNFEDGVVITANKISNIGPISFSGEEEVDGINCASETLNSIITQNQISEIRCFGTLLNYAFGIRISTVNSGTTIIANNFISDILAPSQGQAFAAGIYAEGGIGSLTNIYSNTVSMTGSRGNATQPGYALAIGGNAPSVDVRNNILLNTQTSDNVGKSYSIGTGYVSTPGNYANLLSDYNDLYSSGSSTIALASVGSFSQSTLTNLTTIADWQAETGRDANSKNVQPVFVSSTNLHLTPGSNPLLENSATPLALVNNDIDCDVRHNVTPDIGADEICSSTFYRDQDGDGYGNAGITTQACLPPSGYVTNNADCNDNNALINPAATEICNNNVDDDCDGQTDEGCGVLPFVSINDMSVYESEGQVNLSVSLSRATNLPVKINYKTIENTAVSSGRNKDYKGIGNSSITIPAGQLNAIVSIEIYMDNINETDENFNVQLTKASNAQLGDNSGTVTIHNGTALLITEAEKGIRKSSATESQQILIYPNPATGNFILDLRKNKLYRQMTMQVADMYGRIIETRNVNTNSTIRFGDRYRPGTYFVKIFQGKEHKELKVIKLSD